VLLVGQVRPARRERQEVQVSGFQGQHVRSVLQERRALPA
jgi:hypothetical protein